MKTTLLYVVMLLLLTIPPTLQAEPPEPPPHRPDREETGEAGRERAMRGFMRHLKESDEVAHDRLNRLRQEDADAFRQAVMREMHQRQWQPANRPPPARGNRPGIVDRQFERLEQERPEEFARLKALRESDPEAFREELRSHFAGREREFYQQPGIDLSSFEQRVSKLKAAWMEARSIEARKELREELRTTLGEMFEAMAQAEEEKLRQIEQELERMRAMLEKRRELREQVVERRLEQLLTPGARPGPRSREKPHE